MNIFRTLHSSLLLLFVVVVIAIVTLAHFTVGRIVAEQSRAQQKSISPAIHLVVDNIIRPLHIAQTLAQSTEIRQIMAAEPVDEEAAFARLRQMQEDFGMYFFIASEQSRIQYHSDGTQHPLTEGKVDWYFKYKDAPVKAIADVGKWEAPHFFIDLKIYDENDRFLGFFGTGTNLTSFIELFAEYKVDHGYDFLFLNPERQIMLSSDPELIGNRSGFHSLDSLPWYQQVVSEGQQHELNNLLIRKDNQDYLIAEIELAPFNWTLLILTPLQARQSEISQAFIASVVGLLLVVFALFLLIYNLLFYFRRSSRRPMMIDPLLNLDTRDEAINQFNRLVELHGQAAVVLVNIVNVKEINTLLGHNTGDYALRFSAKVFREHLTNEDFVSRWRGESFVLTLPGQSLSEAKAVAEQIRFSLTITQVHGLDRQFQLQTTVAVSHSTHGQTLPAIITDAEKHLGQAGPKAFRQVILCEDARTAETTD